MKHNTLYIKHYTLVLSLISNLLLIGALIYIGGYRTDFFKRVYARIAHKPYVPVRADNDCVLSWNNCIARLDMQADVVFFGDSHIAGGDFQKAFPNVKSINLGYIGEDTKGMLRRVMSIAAVHPKKVFLMGGINGLSNQSLEDFRERYAMLVDAIIAAVPDAELILYTLLPVTASSYYCDNNKIIQANQIIQHIAEERNLKCIDLHREYAIHNALPEELSYDGLHLAEEAYDRWYKAIKELIME